jgi:hypothetical protein
MALIMGMPNLAYIFEEKHYQNLTGGILAAFATLFILKSSYIYIRQLIRKVMLSHQENLALLRI